MNCPDCGQEEKTSHTPGPWQVVEMPDRRSKGYIRRVGAEVGEMAVARVMLGRPWSEQDANARLIAAAPELLSALQDAVVNCGCSQLQKEEGHHHECFAPRAMEVIRKAGGNYE